MMVIIIGVKKYRLYEMDAAVIRPMLSQSITFLLPQQLMKVGAF